LPVAEPEPGWLDPSVRLSLFGFCVLPRFPFFVLISAYQVEKTMKIRRMSDCHGKKFVDALKVCLKE